ncbi:class D sortase [Marinihelvus fidelis]|uniref:Class D sortase n=1 Tax=Marinihelvus fidelis TaxID=2613842 RepID=A0A5N0T8J9_9GAMM|nr:class D sortase [Marinihelvus fidelis]KAA9130814.1 class D sortase [Marinihelvus fidelis]
MSGIPRAVRECTPRHVTRQALRHAVFMKGWYLLSGICGTIHFRPFVERATNDLMTGTSNGSRPRKLFGNAMMAAGVVLLASFGLAKGWSSTQSQAGVDAFEANRAAMQAGLQSSPPPRPSHDFEPDTANAVAAIDADAAIQAARESANAAWYSDPDFSLWSEKRVKDFEDSLKVESDAPHAVLNIDHLNIRVPVYNGADEFNLNRGVARIIGTGRIGETGNLGIAGHRDGFFRPLKDIKVGDTFELETYYGTETYAVSSIDIVDPADLHVLAPTDAPTVTLVTCYPFYHVGHAPKRFIVKGEVVNHQVNS